MNNDFSVTILGKIRSNNNTLKEMDKLLSDRYLDAVTAETKLRNLNVKLMNLNIVRTISSNNEQVNIYTEEVSVIVNNLINATKTVKNQMVNRQKLIEYSFNLEQVYRSTLALEHNDNNINNNNNNVMIDFSNIIEYNHLVNYEHNNIDITEMDIETATSTAVSQHIIETYNKISDKVRECFVLHNNISDRLRGTFNVNPVILHVE
ncbi:MAG: hypothetical protein Terrestrivirus5_182 [Terrestrivirus sp.]|uniref:Uncharacterized protein n=1 Tax=Terrestrivirus sp. TaxID=2487775 RepID=A0A3G4ZN93_9VIRU|nr:MAG: hypothetical protein Terrestrivirus5_182 [Terrestrivirus sp.]